MNNENIIEVKNVSKVFKIPDGPFKILKKQKYIEEVALKDVSFNVKKGECLGLLGRNGSGKSTILKIICKVMTKSAGDFNINGLVLPMLEVGTGFNPELNAIENIILYNSLLGVDDDLTEDKIKKIIEFAEIQGSEYKQVKFYSSGMYIRIAFSVAASQEPDVIILDEVLAVGDPKFQEKCINRMRELKQNSAMIFVSHNLDQISKICDRCLIFEKGKIIHEDLTPKAIEYYKKYLGLNE